MSRINDEYAGLRGGSSRGDLSRGEFLRLAGGAGLGISLSGGLGAFGADEARAAEILGGRFPIGVWWPPPPEYTSVERYREIAGAGFNFVIGGNGGANDTANPKALEAAGANGLRFILADARLHQAIRGGSGSYATQSVPDGSRTREAERGAVASPMSLLREQDIEEEFDGGGSRSFNAASAVSPEERVGELFDSYGRHPALSGVNLFDEPHASYFGRLARAKNALRSRDGGLLPHVNVWPSHTSPSALGVRNYPTYLQRYTSTVGSPMLSFDHYPLLAGKAHTRDYFYNWALIRRYSLLAGVPSWVFIQSVDFDGRNVGLAYRRRPSRADLLWQINVSLAYGAKGVQYFTYWTPENARSNFGQALISKSGVRTPLYYHAQSVNGYLRVMGGTMLPLRSELIVHARVRRPPLGAHPFRRDAYVSSVGGSPVIMGWFRRPGGGVRERFLFIVNRSSFKRSSSILTMGPRVAAISRFAPAGRRFVPVRKPRRERGPRKLRVRLAPGAAQLFILRRR